MPSPPSYGCCTRVNFVLKKHLLLQMNLSNSGLKNRSIKKYWLIFTVLKFPLGLQFSHNLTKFKIIKYISTIIYIMTTTCTYLQQLTQVSDVAHGPLVCEWCCLRFIPFRFKCPLSSRKSYCSHPDVGVSVRVRIFLVKDFVSPAKQSETYVLHSLGRRGGGRVVRWCWVTFQCRGVLQFGLQ